MYYFVMFLVIKTKVIFKHCSLFNRIWGGALCMLKYWCVCVYKCIVKVGVYQGKVR